MSENKIQGMSRPSFISRKHKNRWQIIMALAAITEGWIDCVPEMTADAAKPVSGGSVQ